MSGQRIARAERGSPDALTIDLGARMAVAVGLQLGASLHPDGDPVRDRGQLALLARLRARLGSGARLRTEVPVPITGDLRSGDGVLAVAAADGVAEILIEAETHVDDVQLVERRAGSKQRDLGARRLVLLLADTRYHRELLMRHPELRERFPIGARRCLAALSSGVDPGGDCILLL